MQIAVIASRSLERAKEFAKKHGIPKAYGSYEELAKDPDIGELRAISSLAVRSGIMAFCSCCLKLSLEHLCPHRHCVPGSAAHRALASWSALPQGWEECVVRETFRYELQAGERPCRHSQEKQCLPDGGKIEGIHVDRCLKARAHCRGSFGAKTTQKMRANEIKNQREIDPQCTFCKMQMYKIKVNK